MLDDIDDINEYEKGTNRPSYNSIQNNIYRSRIRRFRKRSEDEKSYKYDFEKGKLIYFNDDKNTYNDIRKNDSIILYRERIRRFNHRAKRDNSVSDMIISEFEPNEEDSDNRTLNNNSRNILYSPIPKFQSPSKRTPSSMNDMNFRRRIKTKKKKVNFKRKFVTIIDIESYKKYNMENNCLNDKAEAKCTCLIY
jgi:hypothetical protein